MQVAEGEYKKLALKRAIRDSVTQVLTLDAHQAISSYFSIPFRVSLIQRTIPGVTHS